MKEISKVTTDQQLSDLLGVSKVTIASWRKRGSVPLEKVLLFSQKSMVSIDNVLFGSGGIKTHDVDNEWSYGLAVYLYHKASGNFLYGDGWNTCLWWGRIFPHLVQHYEYEVTQTSHIEGVSIDEATEKMRDAIDDLAPSDIIKLIERRFEIPRYDPYEISVTVPSR